MKHLVQSVKTVHLNRKLIVFASSVHRDEEDEEGEELQWRDRQR